MFDLIDSNKPKSGEQSYPEYFKSLAFGVRYMRFVEATQKKFLVPERA